MATRPVQTYANHVHRPTMALVAAAASVAALFCAIGVLLGRTNLLAPALVLLGIAVLVLSGVARIYIVRLQDRIIRTEMRMRLAALAPSRAADLERLSMPQLVALRFASDAEVVALMGRALAEDLSNAQIKQAVKEWVPDYHRT